MTATATTHKVECPTCHGKGTYFGYVQWSDGLGGTDLFCYLCDRTGYLDADPVTLARRYKERLAEVEGEYRKFVLHTAMYLKTSRGQMPDPPFKAAPATTSNPSVWLEKICKEIKKLARVQPGDCGHTDPAICRQNIEKYPTSYQDNVCRVTVGMPQLSATEKQQR